MCVFRVRGKSCSSPRNKNGSKTICQSSSFARRPPIRLRVAVHEGSGLLRDRTRCYCTYIFQQQQQASNLQRETGVHRIHGPYTPPVYDSPVTRHSVGSGPENGNECIYIYSFSFCVNTGVLEKDEWRQKQ